MWAAQYLKYKKTQKFITSGGLGTMGFGYGAAIGAQIGCPDRRVIHFTGDGSFHMNMNEACTAVSEGLPIITIIMDNKVRSGGYPGVRRRDPRIDRGTREASRAL